MGVARKYTEAVYRKILKNHIAITRKSVMYIITKFKIIQKHGRIRYMGIYGENQ